MEEILLLTDLHTYYAKLHGPRTCTTCKQPFRHRETVWVNWMENHHPRCCAPTLYAVATGRGRRLAFHSHEFSPRDGHLLPLELFIRNGGWGHRLPATWTTPENAQAYADVLESESGSRRINPARRRYRVVRVYGHGEPDRQNISP